MRLSIVPSLMAPLFCATLLVHAPAHAAPAVQSAAVVEGVQMPAWVERGAARTPIAPGMLVQGKDRIVTGDNGRILLRMPEGSTIKLGEKAIFNIDSLSAERDGNGVNMTSALNVLTGAFRFTTGLAQKFTGRRNVDIRFATATAGIRGTDVWGKTDAERELICLIEGKVEVTRANEAPVLLNDPLTFYVVPAGQPPNPVAPVPAEELMRWAQQTEFGVGQGVAQAGGKWKVLAASVGDQNAALAVYDVLRGNGYPAEIRPRGTAVARIYDVQIAALGSEADARAVAQRIATLPGVTARVRR